MKYLVVDDARLARRMTIKSLKQIYNNNLEVLEATNGQEAVELYNTHKPDICFMDLTMPVLDGFDATKMICSNDPEAQVIIVSADIQEQSVQKAREAGAIGFIKKPIDIENLENMLKDLDIL